MCLEKAASLKTSDYLDIDYDAISQTLVLTIFHHTSPASSTWSEQIFPLANKSRTEIGVLASEKAVEPEEVTLSGFLAVLGEDTSPSK